jgi:hypothetical protein
MVATEAGEGGMEVGEVLVVIMTAVGIRMAGTWAMAVNHIVEDRHQEPRRIINTRRPLTIISAPRQRLRDKATNHLRILTIYDQHINNHNLMVFMRAVRHHHMVAVTITRVQGAVGVLRLLEEHTDQVDTEVASEILLEDMGTKVGMADRRHQLIVGILVEVIVEGTTGEGTQQAPLIIALDLSLMEIRGGVGNEVGDAEVDTDPC